MRLNDGSAGRPDELEQLSALLDGELDGDAAAAPCARWRDDAALRRTWQQWSLIGDVLRSDDLASPPRHDAAFLHALRGRLSEEPVVLAPMRKPAPVSALRRRSRWIASSAVAAGFVAVAGTALVVLREPAPGTGTGGAMLAAVPLAPPQAQGATPAQSPARVLASTGGSPAAAESEPQPLVADPKLIRDARLDRYLAAHKQFAGSSALGVPSGYLRAATTTDAAAR